MYRTVNLRNRSAIYASANTIAAPVFIHFVASAVMLLNALRTSSADATHVNGLLVS